MGIDQLFVGRRRRREDAEPGERIRALERGQDAGGNRRPAHAVKTVAASDDLAVELDIFAAAANLTLGALESTADTATSLTSNMISPPASMRARIRSLTTSCCP